MKATRFDPARSVHDQGVVTFFHVGAGPVAVFACRFEADASTERPRRFLLLHGNPSHVDHFRSNIAFLCARGEVAAFDAPGFGQSPAPERALTLDFLADVAAAYAARLGWTSGVTVIGQSHGGAVAQTLAARHRALVEGVVLLGTMGYPAHFSMRLAMLPGAAAVTHGIARLAGRQPFRALARAFARAEVGASFAPDPVPDGFVERELARVLASPSIQRSSVSANDGDPTRQLRAQAGRIRTRVLFIHGRDDRLVPVAYARRLARILDESGVGCRFVEVEGGHMVHLVRPERVHSPLAAWLDAPPPEAAPSA